MTRPFVTACLQVNPTDDLAGNLSAIERLTRAAVAEGAEFVALPEFATFLHRSGSEMRAAARIEAESEALDRLRALARAEGVWLLVGSLVMLDDGGDDRLRNRSFLIAPDGDITASYDKIHLFDAHLADGRVVGESKHYKGGNVAPVVRTDLATFGMSVCYDLRFPQLYRALARAGAEVLLVPAAFTAQTGPVHWEPLLRARAIETGCFVFAPATSGDHPGDWQTHGHAMIIGPWGEILAACTREDEGYCLAEIDPAQVAKARSRISSLNTNPDFTISEITSGYERTAK